MASEKNLNSILIDETSFNKIQNISKFMGATYAGLGPDFKVILKKARKDFQNYKLSFMDDLMPIHSLSREIANLMQVNIYINDRNTLNQEESDHLDYAVLSLDMIEKAIIYSKLILLELIMVKLKVYLELKAGAIGKNRMKANQNLEKRYKDELSLDDGLAIVISTLKEGYDGEVNEKNIEIAVLKSNGFELLTPEQIKNYLKD